MPTVRLSGTLCGPTDPNREIRARMLYLLFANGWDIYNSNGDQRITLSNIEKKIKEANSFLFMPGASLEDLFKAVSIFVGYQTIDPNLSNKGTVILNTDGSWNALFDLLSDLNRLGTIHQDYTKFLISVDDAGKVIETLERVSKAGVPDAGRTREHQTIAESFETPPPADLKGNVCVFCSATTKDRGLLQDGYALGKMLVENKFGCVSGAGKTGAMGAVVRGAYEAGGWTGGSNVPHIIEIEGLPDGLSSFWLKPDIYTRMEVMIEKSNAFVIFPGGAGSLQEVLALLIFKQQKRSVMQGKPIIIFNRPNGDGTKFWDRLIALLEPWKDDGLFDVVESLDEIVPVITGERVVG